MEPLATARLAWRDGQPFASDYGDIYYSGDGIDEVERVFLTPAGLSRRNPVHISTSNRTSHFGLTVGELGFGTGLNFALCAQALTAQRQRLHFISFEAHPLSNEDWQRVARQRADLPLLTELATAPPPPLSGWHRRSFDAGRIILSLYHGEVLEGLGDLLARSRVAVDAWLLDGFAPDRNPAMWRVEILREVARLSRPGTTVATFTARGQVRRDLESVGFEMRRVDQRPHKRESLAGVFTASTDATGNRSAPQSTRHITVHGGGIGGAILARQCAEAGIEVTLRDLPDPANELEYLVQHARLLGDGTPMAAQRVSAFHYATAYLAGFKGVVASGSLQLTGANLDAAKLDRIARFYAADDPHQQSWIQRLEPAAASRLAGTEISGEALYFPTSAVISTSALLADLLTHPAIRVERLQTPQTTLAPGCNVLCTGTASRGFEDLDWLEVADVYGQLDRVEVSTQLGLPVLGRGYFIPLETTQAIIGSSYEYRPWPAAQAYAHNLSSNEHLLSGVTSHIQHQRGRRCISSDRIPLVGRLGDDLYIATAHGSMGTTSAPLAAAIIASHLLGWVPPCSAAVENVMLPQRFIERQRRRGRRHR